ncbi:class I SAM-dependent methyltransferase [Bacillus weihaiensis]|uniref:Phosphatidylethanolamine N-methyltransferase n=1 Tax=Bacillus weihaiensis TaxID=1547283 RepID=A0A1L3MSQ4_9BACI|nr:class I SAM-dependent methyltransferase [Bacillus weihaiensis]APH05388.1 phosphatidylethanolamine N-methyltransferase [Bacillus weihaiensis]
MNNRWNEIIYKIWSPIYDSFFNTGRFLNARKEIFSKIEFERTQKILFVGIGTGADLELIQHKELDITAIDYSFEMLNKAKTKFKETPIHFLRMDAQDMSFQDHQFDIIIGSLILSVVPDPVKCLEEMIRVLKPNGSLIIFDKFIPKNTELSLCKKGMRPLIKLLGTDIGISFETLYEKHINTIIVQEDTDIMFNGMYRKIILTKRTIHPG